MTLQTLPQLVGKDKASKLLTLAHSQTKNPGRFQKQYDLQYSFLANDGQGGIGQIELILNNGFAATSGAPTPGNTYATFLAALQHPFSRGNIHITTSDPFTLPAADPHYFEKTFDLELMSLGSQTIRKLSQTGPWAKYIVGETVPGPSVQTDDQFREYVKAHMSTEYHPTASLLPRKDGGVVDPKLKVYGTSNLRVADASIMPLHISAHIQATTFAIGELAAKFVKASH
jgi:choline dehydrogenase-like flavoprotein